MVVQVFTPNGLASIEYPVEHIKLEGSMLLLLDKDRKLIAAYREWTHFHLLRQE